MKKLGVYLLGLLLLLTTLSGCVKMRSHVTINPNGSAEVEHTLAVSDSVAGMAQAQGNGDPFTEITSKYEKDGFTVSAYKQDELSGIRAKKHVKSLRDLPAAMGSLTSGDQQLPGGNKFSEIGKALTVKKSLFTTEYTLDATLDLSEGNDAPTGDNAKYAAMLNSMVDLSFALTLPVKPKSANTKQRSDGGRTLEWPLKLGEKNKLQAVLIVPNFLNLGIAAGGLFVVGIVLGSTVMRRRRRRVM